jgi:copper chaperone CopZ
MNDEELRKLLQHSLAGRSAPAAVRERIIRSLRRARPIVVAVAAAAALLVLGTAAVVGAFLHLRPARLNPTIARAIEQHIQSPVFGHAASSPTPREVTQTVSEASGREIQMPGLRDVGFTQMQAHRCEATGWAHVIYANSWLKVSCFLLDAEGLDLSGGQAIQVPGIDAHSFVKDRFSVVAVRESGLAKIWVGDLRPEQLAAIACDAEQKRHQLQTTVLSVPDRGVAKQLGAMLQSTPGVEDIQLEPAKQEAYVRFDRRRVTIEEIAALLATNGFAASPRDWSGTK